MGCGCVYVCVCLTRMVFYSLTWCFVGITVCGSKIMRSTQLNSTVQYCMPIWHKLLSATNIIKLNIGCIVGKKGFSPDKCGNQCICTCLYKSWYILPYLLYPQHYSWRGKCLGRFGQLLHSCISCIWMMKMKAEMMTSIFIASIYMTSKQRYYSKLKLKLVMKKHFHKEHTICKLNPSKKQKLNWHKNWTDTSKKK